MLFKKKFAESHWLSISDLMSGLMMVFMFIALAYMQAERKANEEIYNTITQLNAEKSKTEEARKALSQRIVELQQEKIRSIQAQKDLEEKNKALNEARMKSERVQEELEETVAKLQAQKEQSEDARRRLQNANNRIGQFVHAVDEAHHAILSDLEEFRDELQGWNVEINPDTLSLVFKDENAFFKSNEATLSPEYKHLLDVFFPKYIRKIYQKHKNEIKEVRIEGHTSSEWTGMNTDDAYFLNMDLSQRRTRAVLEYCYSLVDDPEIREFMKEKATANGLSSSHPLPDRQHEDKEKSRRVEFSLLTTLSEKAVENTKDLVGAESMERIVP